MAVANCSDFELFSRQKDASKMAWEIVKCQRFGIWEYLSQSNDNANCISESFKFVDDLSFLEIINLLSVGIASYNVRAHVPSDVLVNNQVIPAKNLKTQDQLRVINDWTKKKKMRLNIKTSTYLCTDPRPLLDYTGCYYLFIYLKSKFS